MVRHTEEVDDETPAENPPAFDDLIDTVDDLEPGDHVRITYAHKSRHTLDEPDKTSTIDAYVTVADVTFDGDRTRFRLETQSSDPDSGYTGAKHRIKDGGVNKTQSNPCFVSKSTGPSARHFQQLGRVDSIEVVDDTDVDDDIRSTISPEGYYDDFVDDVEGPDAADVYTVTTKRYPTMTEMMKAGDRLNDGDFRVIKIREGDDDRGVFRVTVE